MSVVVALIVVVTLLVAVVSIALAGGLGYIAYRRPSLREPMGLALVALGVIAAILFGLVQAVRP